jgi:O-antigen ligase/polysaccharide polymerase Wzy-like membrane protein
MKTVVLVAMCAGLPLLWLRSLKLPARHLVRDRAVQAALWATALWLLWVEPFLGVAGISVLLRWFDHADYSTRDYQPVLWVWLLAVGLWFGARSIPANYREIVAAVWLAWALIQGALVWGQWFERSGWLASLPAHAGTFGQRATLGVYLALVFPLAFLFPSPARWLLAAGLLAAQVLPASWLGLLAMTVAACVLAPKAALWLLLGLGASTLFVLGSWKWKIAARTRDSWIDQVTTRGGSLDSVIVRLQHWQRLWLVWRQWPAWLTGRGIGRGLRDTLRVQVGIGDPIQKGHAHNDWIEFAYEHGLMGILAIALLMHRISTGLQWEDPWSASAVAGAVIASGTYSTRLAPLAAPWWCVLAWTAT